ncbi:MAG: hypothetical protein L6R35_005756 [Caloplaca aegaea]|nr:MAG: hypothetical protein L6R35_005756 [Caloplaca aegaea]
MSEKKRKRTSLDAGQRPGKRAAIVQKEPDSIRVTLIPEEDEWAPVIDFSEYTRSILAYQYLHDALYEDSEERYCKHWEIPPVEFGTPFAYILACED